MVVTAVVFDVGETLLDETRYWTELADLAGVEHETFFAALDEAIATGDHRRVWDLVGEPLPELPPLYEMRDLFPDAPHCLARLREAGYFVGVAANQPPETEDLLRRMFPFDLIRVSSLWGVTKPQPEFFERLSEELLQAPEQIAYVGDRVDNDVLPALAAGMTAVHVRRGRWSRVQDAPPEAIVIDSLEELPGVFA
jgi:HAD superfamily hydrolase (TIGR01549 family)